MKIPNRCSKFLGLILISISEEIFKFKKFISEEFKNVIENVLLCTFGIRFKLGKTHLLYYFQCVVSLSNMAKIGL